MQKSSQILRRQNCSLPVKAVGTSLKYIFHERWKSSCEITAQHLQSVCCLCCSRCFKTLGAAAACFWPSAALLFWWRLTRWRPGVTQILLSSLFILPSVWGQRLREERSGFKRVCPLLSRACCNALSSTRRAIHQHLPISRSGLPTCLCWSCLRAFVRYVVLTDHSAALRSAGSLPWHDHGWFIPPLPWKVQRGRQHAWCKDCDSININILHNAVQFGGSKLAHLLV